MEEEPRRRALNGAGRGLFQKEEKTTQTRGEQPGGQSHRANGVPSSPEPRESPQRVSEGEQREAASERKRWSSLPPWSKARGPAFKILFKSRLPSPACILAAYSPRLWASGRNGARASTQEGRAWEGPQGGAGSRRQEEACRGSARSSQQRRDRNPWCPRAGAHALGGCLDQGTPAIPASRWPQGLGSVSQSPGAPLHWHWDRTALGCRPGGDTVCEGCVSAPPTHPVRGHASRPALGAPGPGDPPRARPQTRYAGQT